LEKREERKTSGETEERRKKDKKSKRANAKQKWVSYLRGRGEKKLKVQ